MNQRLTRTALRTHSFTESVIREMTRVAREHDAVNLAQGFPDFPCPDLLKEAACDAIHADVNQYAITWGAPNLRHALAKKYHDHYGMEVDTETEITITCGGTEAMASVMLGIVDPGEEVIVFEPFYENYGPDAILCGAKPVFVTLEAPDYRLEKAMLDEVVSSKTRAIVINTPNNPTGRVFDREEMQAIADVCLEHDIIAITDEIYEHIYYEGEHHPLATFDGMRDRTITISGLSKTFSVTGWRIGTIISPPALSTAIRKIHDFLTVGAPAPLQEACAVGLNELGPDYYSGMVAGYRERGETLVSALQDAGFECRFPQGAYYILADFSALSDEDSMSFGKRLTAEAGVAPVPGGSFFSDPARGHSLARFVFCKQMETLHEAADRLRHFAAKG
ncbi:MAG: aminotransferase class I/II-fold pyridoxal phosphate-dependent enzyme [Gemmatimonadota bacterium]